MYKILSLGFAATALADTPQWTIDFYDGAAYDDAHGRIQWNPSTNRWEASGWKDWCDRIYSFKLGPYTKVEFFDWHFKDTQGWARTSIYGPYESGDMNAAGDWACNMRLSKFGDPNKPQEGSVVMWADLGCMSGFSGIFGPGYHDHNNLNDNNVPEDTASGIYVPPRTQVTLFEERGYSTAGVHKYFEGPLEQCNAIDGIAQDSVSSLIVTTTDKAASNGFWEMVVQSNSQINETLSKSFTTSFGKSVTKTDTMTVTYSLEEDLIFASESVSYSASHSVAKTSSQIIEQGVSSTCSATCDNPKDELITLWQWQTETHNVRKNGDNLNVKTCYYICHKGDLAHVPPACPPANCKNADCTECTPWKRTVRERIEHEIEKSKYEGSEIFTPDNAPEELKELISSLQE